MSQPSNLYSTYDAVNSNKEDVMDALQNVAPFDTPLLSKLQRTKSKNRKHEWLTDTLDSPSTANAHAEGADFSGEGITAPTREYNACQIFKKPFVVSETQEAVDKHGRKSDISLAKVKKAKAIKTDIESMFFDNNASVDSAEGTARELGGLPAWMETNVSRGSGGSNGGSGTSAATNGTQRAITESMLLSVGESIWNNSGDSDDLMLVAGSFNTRQIATFAGSATPTIDASKGNRVNMVEIYRTNLGTYKVVPCRHVATRDVFLLQPKYLALSVLRPLKFQEYKKDGDNRKVEGIIECTLEVRNEKAHGHIADLNTA